jgi:hypothetical protein
MCFVPQQLGAWLLQLLQPDCLLQAPVYVPEERSEPGAIALPACWHFLLFLPQKGQLQMQLCLLALR